ncbi:MAG: helix-turn-helix domain-containing protein [Candidatus Dormibacteria bacterium]
MYKTPAAVERGGRRLGENLTTWRKLNGLSAGVVAERAAISRDTLRSIEHGTGSASSENLLRVMRVLGILDKVVDAADPYETDVGRLRADERLPQRVRT